jgi:predicted RNA-binding protein with PIN domain
MGLWELFARSSRYQILRLAGFLWFHLPPCVGSEMLRPSMADPVTQFVIVDGHSVIHAWEDLRRLHQNGPRRYLAREALLKRLRLYQDVTGVRVVVVFDGVGSKVTDERESAGVQVFYANSGRTADSVIERLVARYASTYTIRVATADGMERDTVEAFGAVCVSPEELKFEVERAEADLGRRLKG